MKTRVIVVGHSDYNNSFSNKKINKQPLEEYLSPLFQTIETCKMINLPIIYSDSMSTYEGMSSELVNMVKNKAINHAKK